MTISASICHDANLCGLQLTETILAEQSLLMSRGETQERKLAAAPHSNKYIH